MPKVRALTRSYVNDQIVEEGWEGHINHDDIGRNFLILDREVKKAQDKAALPADVERLVVAARLKATARGAETPNEASAVDLRDVLRDLGDAKPSQEVIDAAAKVLEATAAKAAVDTAAGSSSQSVA